jgi:hypothetical protein
MIRDSSPMLAREHGQWGWTTITRVGRPDRRAMPSGQRAGTSPFGPGVAEWTRRACKPAPTARIQAATRRKEPDRDLKKTSTPHLAAVIHVWDRFCFLIAEIPGSLSPPATPTAGSVARSWGSLSGRREFTVLGRPSLDLARR